MKIKGYEAFLKDGVLAIKKDLTLSQVTIEGTTYKVINKAQSKLNPIVFNYYLEENGR